jgi:DNA-binding FadR family transcriptional regulator
MTPEASEPTAIADGPGQPAASAQQRTADALRSQILSGRWAAGQRLPPERELCVQLGVSRLTLRGALTTLASEGLVRARQGSGIEVQDFQRCGAIDLFTWLLSLPTEYNERSAELFAEIARERRLLALDVLMRAAERASEQEVRDLERIAAAQALRVGDPAAYLAGDCEYQRKLIRISGSTAVELLHNSLERVLARHRELALVFLGPLREHHQSYAMIQRLLRFKRPAGLRRLAEAALDAVEVQGLARVREYCRASKGARAGIR